MTESDFISFISPLQSSLYRVAKRLLISHEEAQDALSEVTLKLWDKRQQLAAVKNLEAYAMTMTKHFCLDRLKSKQGSHLRLVHVNYEKATHSLAEQIEDKESVSLIRKAMDTLPEAQKMAVQLRDIEGLDYSQIEEILEMKPNAVRVALSRARKTLRDALLKQQAYGIAKN
ncbi:sigma-70 family RNA polymerase sigma factor [Flavobacteriaceae bacterium LSUCC0859]|nr:sigma-70 family RNA polymerase sigma factor [Flavobacteriaceae bacterium LSUCC0859]